MSETSLEFEAGRLLCGTIRDYLNARRLLHPTLRYHESRGWIVRQFTVAGPIHVITEIERDLTAWREKLGREG